MSVPTCIVDDILSASDIGDLTVLVLLDFSKAFDRIDHSLLLAILHYIGLGEVALHFFRAYLLGRKQAVVAGGKVSDWATIHSGVPQGSILVECVPEHSGENRRDGPQSSDCRISAGAFRGKQRYSPVEIARWRWYSERSTEESSAQVASQPNDDLQCRTSPRDKPCSETHEGPSLLLAKVNDLLDDDQFGPFNHFAALSDYGRHHYGLQQKIDRRHGVSESGESVRQNPPSRTAAEDEGLRLPS
ncbi:hypothetical protein Trydic_g8562 [Trypoxylus dichotomus]